MRRYSATALSFTLSLILAAAISSSAQNRLDKSGWELYWTEEFDHQHVDSLYTTGRWDDNIYPDTVTRPTRKQIKLDKGIAAFHAKLVSPYQYNGHTISAENGDLISTFDEFPQIQRPGPGTGPGFLYGIYEIRCKLPAGPINIYPAFWMAGITWPPEFDAFEYHAGENNFFSSIHYGHGPANRKMVSESYYYDPHELTSKFHTWTIVWMPDAVGFFFDDKELRTDTNLAHLPNGGPVIPGQVYNFLGWNKMNIRVGNGLLWREWGQTEATTFHPLLIDYIRVYKPRTYADSHQFANYVTSAANKLEDWYFNDLLPLYTRTNFKKQDSLAVAIPRLSFYPNPSTGSFKLAWPAGTDVHSISITDVLGRTLINEEHIYKLQGYEADLSQYPSGVYLARIRSNGPDQTIKLIRQ